MMSYMVLVIGLFCQVLSLMLGVEEETSEPRAIRFLIGSALVEMIDNKVTEYIE